MGYERKRILKGNPKVFNLRISKTGITSLRSKIGKAGGRAGWSRRGKFRNVV